ncbi:uncharacterized protein IL334_001783 [Kwoniella shivajii]|uniref:Transmembrane protein n=1 Tax=Kwoniella shivajii TaxID=564305 RepID=A0ABZ1CU23_9TREE|nr:hypothetical protein IL334_001783 [Kwoniella shivajii]
MPISPVSVVVGTTLATAIVVIGTGYAFKKFIYDPHISHHVEALIAQHNHFQDQAHSHSPESIPVEPIQPSLGSSTSYRDHHTSLRRRTGRRSNEFELTDRPVEYGGASAYELDESRLSLLGESPSKSGSVDRLIDIDDDGRTQSPQDQEIREVIFKLPPTPLRSGTATPASTNPFISMEDGDEPKSNNSHLDPRTSSTSFSFLSLSQSSSPEVIHPPLDLATAAQRLSIVEDVEGTPTVPDDEMESIAGTNNTAEYEDAESYTPISRALSPAIVSPAVRPHVVDDMGLSYVPLVPPTRGPMSVISVEGSEFSEVDGEWDVLSDMGR